MREHVKDDRRTAVNKNAGLARLDSFSLRGRHASRNDRDATDAIERTDQRP